MTGERVKRLRTAKMSVGNLRAVDLEGVKGSDLSLLTKTLRILDETIAIRIAEVES